LSLLSAGQGLADAAVKILEATYAGVDEGVGDLDRRMRLLESLIRTQGGELGGSGSASGAGVMDDAGGVDPGLRLDSISSRTRNMGTAGEPRKRGGERAGGGGGGRSSAADSAASGRRRAGGGGGGLNLTPESAMDIAIDPHEPTYCTCGQVAFGEMIACDNEACPTEWFHCQCVSITPATRPKGPWFCPDCRPGNGR
jgi:hypothetical protein